MNKWLCLLILFLTVFGIRYAADAESVPRPNSSEETALLFGDITSPLPPDLTPPPDWQIGMRKNFSVLDVSSGTVQSCTGEVFLITDEIVFWCDETETDLIPEWLPVRLDDFSSGTLPMLRNTFGTENSPGIDNDPRLHVLFTSRIGMNYNGYFSAEDSQDPRVRPSSNGMDLVFLNTRILQQGEDAAADTLSHELQHLIHFSYDPNEMSFINEGFSGLAQYLALGYTRDTFIRNYLNDTGRSLIWWPDSGINLPYYGSSFLFSMYLYDRLDADFIRTVVSQKERGLDGLDRALVAAGLTETADDLFQQWSAALLGQLLEMPVQQWDYQKYVFPQNGIYRDIRELSCGEAENHDISQYGVRFYRSSCGGPFRISLEGSAESPVTALTIPGGVYAWWSGAVSNSAALLSREFDLSSVIEPVHFEYDTVYDIENGYDYYYLLLRTEDGSVSRLFPSSVTAENPAGLNLGGGTTGNSNGIRHEVIDLSPWRGQRIRLTFVYLTDTAGLKDGLMLDNFRIDALGYADDAESPDEGWEAEGFRRIGQTVPQAFLVTVLSPAENGTARAEFYSFSGGETLMVDCPEGNCAFGISAAGREIRARRSFTVETESLVLTEH